MEASENEGQREHYLLLDALCGQLRGLWRHHSTPLTYSLATAMTKAARPTQPVLLSTSAALNKWLKQTIGDGYVVHSFRHSMRDRLRAVNCPSEMIDQIGGWSKRSVGEGCGDGFKADAIYSVMRLRCD